MLRLIGLLLLIPLVDAVLLVVFGATFGWPVMVLAVVLSALLGLLFVRAEGRHTLRKIQRKAAQGEAPTDELVDGGLLLVAGAFLLTPGLVTDAVGLLLVIPLTRYPFRWALKKYVLVPMADEKTGGFVTGNVYISGFPDGEAGVSQRPGSDGDPDPGDAGPGGSSGPDGYENVRDVEFEEVDDDE